MFQIHTTEDVLAETLSQLRDAHPRWDGGQTTRIRRDLIEVFDEIVEEFDGSVDYQGLDEGDRHVHAAAIGCDAHVLLTCDNGLLSQPNSEELSYEAFHPDDFFVLVHDSAPLDVRQATLEQLEHHLRTRGVKNTGIVDALIAAGCPKFAEIVRIHLLDLSGILRRGDRRKFRRGERLEVPVESR